MVVSLIGLLLRLHLKGTQFDEKSLAKEADRGALEVHPGPSREHPDLLPKSTAESELYAASDGLEEEGMKMHNIGKEICLKLPDKIIIHIDALVLQQALVIPQACLHGFFRIQ